jgi:hypothetical protein
VGAIFLIGVVLLLAVGTWLADQQVFIPFAPTYAITQTAEVDQSATPHGTSTSEARPTPTPRGRQLPTITPLPGDEVQADQS